MQIEQKLYRKQILFKEAFQLLVDGTKPDVLQPLMELKLEHMNKRHGVMISILEIWVEQNYGNDWYTCWSCLAMLANLSDPSLVGPAMAVALLTTIYGALLGTLFAGIIESKLFQKA